VLAYVHLYIIAFVAYNAVCMVTVVVIGVAGPFGIVKIFPLSTKFNYY